MGKSERLLIVITFILAIICTATITVLLTRSPMTGTDIGGGITVEQIEGATAKFLSENPHVIVQAYKDAKQKQADFDRKNAEEKIAQRADELNNDPNSPFTGNKDGDVTIVAFSDYNCGFCKRIIPDVVTLLKEDPKVKFVSKDFPILGPRSVSNSKAALAASAISPDKWFDFHKAILKTAPKTDGQLLALAKKVGIDQDKLKVEMAKPEHQKQLEKNLALGQAIGVRGTPAFVINGEFVRGAIGLDLFKQRVAAARQRLAKK